MYLDLHSVGVVIVSTQRPDMTCGSGRQLVLVHLFDDNHAFQEIKLFLTILVLGRHCHVLVSLEETFRRRLRAVTHFHELVGELRL